MHSHMQPYTIIHSHIPPYTTIQPYTTIHSHMQLYRAIYNHMAPYRPIRSHIPITNVQTHVFATWLACKMQDYPNCIQTLFVTQLQLSRNSLQLSRVANHIFKTPTCTFRGPICTPKCLQNLPKSFRFYVKSIRIPSEIYQDMVWGGLGGSCGASSVQRPYPALAYHPFGDLWGETNASKGRLGKPHWSKNRCKIWRKNDATKPWKIMFIRCVKSCKSIILSSKTKFCKVSTGTLKITNQLS